MLNSTEQLATQSSFFPQVSVIIPIYNGEEDLSDLINCLRSQTYPNSKIEYLLVNNNSNDNTSKILGENVIEMTEIGINLKVLNENKIQSSYAARNQGIRHATGEILAFTDADCRPIPNWIEELVKPFMDEKVGIVVGELTALPGESLWEKYAERYEVMSQKFLLEHPFLPYGQTANLGIRYKIFQEVGLFRPYLTTGGDADICWRIQQKTNWKIGVSPQAIIRHRHRSSLKEFQSQFRRYGCSNRYLHDLYDVNLMPEFTIKEASYRLGSWLFKDIPKNMIKLIMGKATPLDLIKTPIDLIRFQARSQGQKEAQLPENAKEIEWLSN
ncbi:glycosyltransferase [Aphanothece sacrum]|uniref:Glycosyl transferase n=1 Tax=Aphanothece sacrum FPU1 TaxID=1920663 RepID=A0A401IFB3_APHSA|nr:glycosyltransferase [Aphanothece sacrum]GBF79987.1 glycosyl transferase [Aphanothece sacrum FPU1]GBF83793.1 glycosyl transferase [Aphanothece sacrum FPU3]